MKTKKVEAQHLKVGNWIEVNFEGDQFLKLESITVDDLNACMWFKVGGKNYFHCVKPFTEITIKTTKL